MYLILKKKKKNSSLDNPSHIWLIFDDCEWMRIIIIKKPPLIHLLSYPKVNDIMVEMLLWSVGRCYYYCCCHQPIILAVISGYILSFYIYICVCVCCWYWCFFFIEWQHPKVNVFGTFFLFFILDYFLFSSPFVMAKILQLSAKKNVLVLFVYLV